MKKQRSAADAALDRRIADYLARREAALDAVREAGPAALAAVAPAALAGAFHAHAVWREFLARSNRRSA